MKLRWPVRRDTLGKDAVAGLVLGVESVPDGLAAGLLAGVNPLSGLYAYMFGTIGGSFFTSSAFMAVQATGAMAIVIADVPAVHSGDDPARALFTLAVLTGVVMLAAGFLRLGSVLRFVSNAVMVGFISAVGVNIILGQLANLTGYKAGGANRVIRAVNTFAHPGQLHLQSLAIGVVTIALILLLERTRLGPLGLVLAVIITSAAVAVLGWSGVATVGELSVVPRSLPLPEAPVLRLVPSLVIPAVSLAFVGLVQGAGISANFPNPDGRYPDASRDFIGQGAANVIAGIFRGMPVGGSMSATSLNKSAGAQSRIALMIAGVDGGGDPRLRRPGRPHRHAGPGRPAHAGRLPDHQAWRSCLGVEDRPRAEDGAGDHLRAHHGHPVAVRGARRRGAVGDLARRAAVEPDHHQAPAARPGRELHRDRPADPAARRRGGRAPALRESVLRRRAGSGSPAPGPG